MIFRKWNSAWAMGLLSVSVAWAGQSASPWVLTNGPAIGVPESIGTPSAGCLRGAAKLAEDGTGYYLMRVSRGRSYGHPRLVQLLQSISKEIVTADGAPVLFGDLSLPRGGPTMSAHSSHQTGLDADVWYMRPKHWRVSKISIPEREKTSSVSVINKKKLAVNRNFGDKQINLLRAFAEKQEVDRILVNFAVKRALCKKMPEQPWIRKIRPWFGHDHHFHVRLKCTDQDTACKNGEEIPTGNGCDASLDWWWSAEARLEERKNLFKQDNPVMPVLPPPCTDVLKM
ncbi:MAG TPA: penicillin-insensitive murein endopeptidase [Bdellovibrionota bacterium]|nr:penicillin-insensitive murein endopeptidase [Bdellovibrionota bacterium]